MIQLAYVSSTTGLLTVDGIEKILVVSREKNRKLGITGMLLYKGGNVLQVLEGEEEAVVTLFEVIRKDERHGGIIRLYQKSVLERDFPEWTMGFHELNAESTRRLEGFTEFLNPRFNMHEIKPSAAAVLLNCFKSGNR
jgi:hypothetical protein